ncbi:MAG: hypothetical protein A3F77_18680 [Betaproteobacteria bacterium RIFCSPLOWO2_12_FULL_67_28]|nr:MAG: hypothetical protein A3F77_18680 [Betaproteobacteria bacterium RIFCSPLOWO2_12_FULL_67_28]
MISIAVAACFATGVAMANPVGPSVVAGQASFNTIGKSLTVTNSPNAIINWQGFSIGTGEITRFQQQSAASAVLNRVVGQDPSAILGTLWSNGKVYLVNPNGILFGQGSRVDVAGLVATTLNLSNGDFLAGRLNFEAGAVANSLVNQGEVVSGSGGRILLIAPEVQNHGLISSPQGEVVLAAGKSVQLVEADLPMLKVEVQAGGEALNVGQILAEGGKIGVYAGLINQRGVVRADSASVDASGKIVFRSSDTTLVEAGSVTSASGAKGGEIQVLGNKVGLTGDARVDASGEAGGGMVLIGGDFQGKNPEVPNAYRTYFGPEAMIKADAISSGDGGKVIVWSDDATRAYGTISARGGAQGGNGGLVETSGHYLDVTRAPDVSAPNGKGGTWLLDPWDITISAASDQNSSNVGSGTTYDFRASASPSVVSVSTITTALAAGGNVTVRTSGSGTEQGNITVASPITTTQTTVASLTLTADNDIQATSDILLGSNVDLYLYATNSIATANLGGRYVSASASNGTITTGSITGGSSGVYLYASGAVQPGAITTGNSVSLQSANAAVTVPAINVTNGYVSVYSYDDMTLTGAIVSTYETYLDVRKPGGLLTMASGSSIKTNDGYGARLRADDMVLGGTIDTGTNGYVKLDPYNYGRDIHVGTSAVAGALNLSPAEFGTITAGTLYIGEYSSNYGSLTVSSALTPTDVKAPNLYLYGRSITTSDLGVTGQLYLYSYGGDITTGTLSAGYVNANSYYNSTGGITTGTINTASSVYLYAYGPVRPSAIMAGSDVNLQSNYAGVTVPDITTTNGSIYVRSFDDITLASALSSPYYTELHVQKPGGVLTMASGSSITSGNGYTVQLRADDMALGGSISTGGGSVSLDAYNYGRDINIGTGTVAGALNLSPAELSTITAGTLNIGNYSSNYGDLTVTGALTSADINNVGNLSLYGRSITTADLGVTGQLYLYSYGGDISTGNLNAGSVNIQSYYNSNGGIATGTINATSSVYLYAYGPVRPGAITADSNVDLSSVYGGVTVPSITTTNGSIYVRSFDELTLTSVLSSPYYTELQVQKPGGVLTMASGSSVTSGNGYSVTLRADDMVLGGTIAAGTNGSVYLDPYSYGRDINIGASAAPGALNLSPAELATVSTANRLHIGSNSSGYGNLTISSALTPADVTAPNLYLYGRTVSTGDLSVTGQLYLYSYGGDVSTGALNAGSSVDINAQYSSSGGIATGPITATSGVSLYAYGPVRTDAITSGGYVQLQSAYAGVTVPSVTTSGSSIYINSHDDLTLTGAFSTPNYVTLEVQKPGGLLTMASGSSIAAGTGYSATLRADDMALGGSISTGTTGSVYLNPRAYGRDINIGSSTVADALNLSVGEFYTITTGTLTIGNERHSNGGMLFVSSPIAAGAAALPANLHLYGANVALGAGITVSGTLGLHGYYNIDGNSTATDLSLAATNIGLTASLGRIYRSGTGVTNINGAANPGSSATSYTLSAALGADLPGTVTANDQTYNVASGDLTLGVASPDGVNSLGLVTGKTVTINVPSGAILDGNGSANNIIANTLNITAGSGIGSSDAIETAVSVLTASSGGSGNIQIANTGNLTASVTHSGTGGLTLTNYGHLSLSAFSVPTGNVSINTQGRLTAPVAIGTAGTLNLTGLADVTTGNLGGSTVGINSTGGRIATGTVTATAGVSMSAEAGIQPGAITASADINLDSADGGIAVSGVTTSGGSINVYSFDDLALTGALSTPYYTNLDVRKPGGVLTMASGSSITNTSTSGGYSATLRADDMALGGSIGMNTSGYVYLDPYSYGRDVSIGTSSVAGALNLTPTELSTVTAGTLRIGSGSSGYGNLTVTGALTPTEIKAANLQLYGRAITTNDLGVTGNLYLYSYGGGISTGNLSAATVDINSNYYSGGGITTGTISATAGVNLSAYGAVQPGAITAGGYVQLRSDRGGVVVPNITTTGGGIEVYSYDDVMLTSALTGAYYSYVYVQKPGGLLTMASGSSITTGDGYGAYLRADDIVLGGTIDTGTNGYVYLDPYNYGRDINVGTSTIAGALNISPAELATLTAGSLYIGNNSSNYGNLTVSSALTPTDVKAPNLYLYGRNITTSDLGVTGQLYLYSYGGDITTGALNAGYVNAYSYYNSVGGIATGTINSASDVYLYAYGSVRPGTITAGGTVQLQSVYAGVTVPNITSSNSSIYVYSFDDLALASTLSSPYYTRIQVQKPGGILTMASGSSITTTSTGGYSVELNADEMALGGSISTSGSGNVYLNPMSYARNINIGTGTVAGSLNLTPTELATISTGTLTIGNYYGEGYNGNLAVTSPIASTDIRASSLRMYGNNVSLGAGIAMNGNLGIYANGNIDANATPAAIDLFATGNVDLIAYNGQIYRTGTGVTNVIAASTNISAPLGVDLGGNISGADVNVTWDQGDYQLTTLTATNVTLNVTNGGIVDTNGTALNITAGNVTLNAADGIGSGKAIDTAISTLTATTGGTGNIEINNTGNLTVTSVSNTGTGNIVLTNAGTLTIASATTAGGSFAANATGALVAGGNITAPIVQLTSGGSITQAAGIISNGTLPAILTTSSVGGTSLTGSNLVGTFSATNSGSGDIALSSTVPLLEITGINQSGGGVTILANDLNLSGPINAGTGLISLAPLANTSDMFVGDATGTGLQISTAEIQQIVSTNVELGRSDGTGNLNISLAPTNIVTGSLRLLAGGSVNILGGPYTLQGGTLQMPGTTNVQSGTSVIVESGALDASGGTVNLNGVLQTTGGSVSAGTLNVGGTLNASGGSLSAGSVNVLTGGLLMGTGTFSANVTNSGTVAPGASPGLMTINGDYVQTSTGTLLVEIAGTTPGTEYDQLRVSGGVTLDGNLTTTLVGGYVPLAGDSFTFIDGSSTISGSFVSTTQPPSLQPPTTIAPTTTTGGQVMVSAVGTTPTLAVPVVVTTQAEITASTLPQQESLPTELASEFELIQSLALEPAGTTQEEKTLAKKPPSCG